MKYYRPPKRVGYWFRIVNFFDENYFVDIFPDTVAPLISEAQGGPAPRWTYSAFEGETRLNEKGYPTYRFKDYEAALEALKIALEERGDCILDEGRIGKLELLK